MSVLFCLVDYYNLVPDKLKSASTMAAHRVTVDRLMAKLLEANTSLNTGASEMRVRFYGGWFQEDQPTDDRLQIGALVRDMPRRAGRSLRILPECADGLFSRTMPLPGTLRERKGLHPFRITPPIPSPGVPPCPVGQLDSWRRGRCPDSPACAIKTENVVTSIGQKLVDSMIVADQIFLSAQHQGAWTATVSNDDDVIPGILTATTLSREVALVRIGRREPSPYERILEDCGAQVRDLTE